jgi:acetyl-CoA carboxylase biotin carboxyl carrier protein
MERFARPEQPGSQQDGTTAELIDAVRELISLMGKGGISELDLTSGDVTIRLRGLAAGQAIAAAPAADTAPVATAPAPPHGHEITAPMIGTYYSAPAPGEAPFVQIGDEIEVGQVVGIIEAMKIMNEIVADRPGVVTEILVENAQGVEYGSPLLRLTDQTDAA